MRYKDCFDKERRDFMRVVKHAGISAGVLKASSLVAGVMLARTADAQTATKHCLVFSGGGCTPSKWFPSGSTLPIQSAPLQTHYGKMVMMRNASLSGAGHGIMFHRFDNGSFSKDSFDVNMGRTIGANYPHKYINVGTTEGTKELTREGSTAKETKTSPQAVLDAFFSGGGGGGGTGTPPRKSVVDLHFAAVNDLKTKLGQAEKDKLDQHFTAIREIETTLTTTNPNPVGTCSPLPNASVMGFDAIARVHTDIIVLALSCNLTASVSIAFGNDTHEFDLDKLGRKSHVSHHFNETLYDQDIAYYQGLTKNLYDKMSAAGLLGSTIITQVSDMGDANGHGNANVPMLVGGAGISGGRVIDMGGKTQTDLYHTLALKLRADQSPGGTAYRNWGGTAISGI